MREFVMATICPYCHALPGQECMTRNGRVSQFLHGARVRPVSRALSRGYSEGRNWATEVMLGENEALKEALIQTYLWSAHRAVAGGCLCGARWPTPLNDDEVLEHEMHLEEVRASGVRP